MNAIDTNILIYAQDPRDTVKQGAAQDLIVSLAEGVLLWQVACEFVAASRKLTNYGFTIERAWDILGEIRQVWGLALPDESVLNLARTLLQAHDLSFWDAALAAACVRAGVRRLYSEDFGDPAPRLSGLEIVNPFS
jgi:predicted nucleic acid-binding protein